MIDQVALAASLSIMWKGMLGIFAVMLLITLVVLLFTKLSK
ncbi:MAG: sodium pump decarboxylase gamma subunit [Eubacteriales bacterium]|nr:sodium pump decarboxylase gamma subunit [Eubacteriales bacterium]